MFPLFSTEFCQKLDPSYLNLIQKLEEDLKTAEDAYIEQQKRYNCGSKNFETEKIIFEFTENYMMPKELWNLYFQDEPHMAHPKFKRLLNLTHYHFYYNKDKTDYATYINCYYGRLLYRKIMDQFEPRSFDFYNFEDICYPHFDMNKRRITCEKDRSKIIRRFEVMKKLYKKIKSVEGNDEKWIEALLESGDVEFAEHNIEYRIGKDLTNKNLWKLYIEFLKKCDKETLIHTYSKYIRFFLDDMEMKLEYENFLKTQKHSETILWKNLNPTEEIVEEIKAEDQDPVSRKRKIQPKKILFSPKNARPQKFPFRPDLINYILAKASYFFSPFVNHIYRCEARHIDIRDQSMTTAELECLIGHGNVTKLKLKEIEFSDNFQIFNVTLEDILKLTPKIENLSIHPIGSSENTAQILNELLLEEKLQKFSVQIEILGANAFGKFVKEHVAPYSKIYIDFISQDDEYDFYQILKNIIQTTWTKPEGPEFTLAIY